MVLQLSSCRLVKLGLDVSNWLVQKLLVCKTSCSLGDVGSKLGLDNIFSH
jgi:hypothetical protein